MPRLAVRLAALGAILSVSLLTACTATAPTAPTPELPPPGASPDYQLGGAYSPAPNVGIVVRDRAAEPASDIYSICYINAFQTQTGELGDWPDERVLRDDNGEPVFDPAWPDEALVDTSTQERRDAIASKVEPWIGDCADEGFQAVEFDNLDSYTRSGGRLTFDDNLALATTLVGMAHARGLAAGQKNAASESATLKEQAGFDFAIAEQCAQFDECGDYTAVYGEHVIDVEYIDDQTIPFDDVCADPATPRSTVLRDRALSTPDEPDFTFALCPSEG